MAWTRAAVGLVAATVLAAVLVSGGSRSDSVRLRYLLQSNELRTVVEYGRVRVVDERSLGEPGVLRGDPWTAPTAWSLAALGHRPAALHLMAELRRAATPAGTLPERVDPHRHPHLDHAARLVARLRAPRHPPALAMTCRVTGA